MSCFNHRSALGLIPPPMTRGVPRSFSYISRFQSTVFSSVLSRASSSLFRKTDGRSLAMPTPCPPAIRPMIHTNSLQSILLGTRWGGWKPLTGKTQRTPRDKQDKHMTLSSCISCISCTSLFPVWDRVSSGMFRTPGSACPLPRARWRGCGGGGRGRRSRPHTLPGRRSKPGSSRGVRDDSA